MTVLKVTAEEVRDYRNRGYSMDMAINLATRDMLNTYLKHADSIEELKPILSVLIERYKYEMF